MVRPTTACFDAGILQLWQKANQEGGGDVSHTLNSLDLLCTGILTCPSGSKSTCIPPAQFPRRSKVTVERFAAPGKPRKVA